MSASTNRFASRRLINAYEQSARLVLERHSTVGPVGSDGVE